MAYLAMLGQEHFLSLSKHKSLIVNMVTRANTLAYHILHHLHLTYKKRSFMSGCDHPVLHTLSNARVTYLGMASS